MKKLKRVQSSVLSVRSVPIANVYPYKGNPRKIPAQAVSAVANSIREFGFRVPIVVDPKGVIICGHARLAAAKKLGLEKVPVHVANLSETKARAYRLADNRTNEISSFDVELLSLEVKELEIEGIELTQFGFREAELKKLAGDDLDQDLIDNEIPQTTKPRTKMGELWILGDHRLFVGDSSEEESWIKLLRDSKHREIDMVFTDPPYGVSYAGKTKDKLTIQNDTEENLHKAVLPTLDLSIRYTKPGGCFYVACPAGPLNLIFANHLHKAGILRQSLVWQKNSLVLGRSDYNFSHEPILYGWKPGASHHAPPTRDQSSVFEIPRPSANPDHPCPKPVELMVRTIINSSDPGWTVCDPFSGSGSTLIASEKTKRRFVGMEIEPKYADLILARWEKYSGRRAIKSSK